jgi:hypothetical protein
MKSLTICLPDLAFEKANSAALNQGFDVANFCASVLADYFLVANSRTVTPNQNISTIHKSSKEKFVVSEYFPNFPSGSVRLAQIFADEAFKFPNVQATRIRRGIGFKPNFVFIEYLMSRGGKAGIGVSFYGEPSRHKNSPQILVQGIPSYSRAKIYSEAELKSILPHIRQSYELKFGSQ